MSHSLGPAGESGRAAIAAAVEAAESSVDPITAVEAVERVSPFQLGEVLHPVLGGGNANALGVGASPGTAVGRAYFSAESAIEAVLRDESVILVMVETTPSDVPAMALAQGVVTVRGGISSHASIVARGLGIPAVCGVATAIIEDGLADIGTQRIVEGDLISIDGSSGSVFVGEQLGVSAPSAGLAITRDVRRLLEWADEIRKGRLGVRANADNAADARKAFDLGADGVGLCRTEHQFLGDRLPMIQRFLVAGSPESEESALQVLFKTQKQDFLELFRVADGSEVTIRLLDLPSHEFWPQHDGSGADISEKNPMLGVRGVRLGVLRPSLYRMQVRAILSAAAEHQSAGGNSQVEIMVPMVMDRSELSLVRGWITQELVQPGLKVFDAAQIKVGCMIETPRAALLAGEIAKTADFLSFGTNDLTQMVFGLSRDDAESSLVPEYLGRSLIAANPFETLDLQGVGAMVKNAIDQARIGNPKIRLGVCGEHGGDPSSIEHLYSYGIDYVSCSTYRLPVARLAGAHAVLKSER